MGVTISVGQSKKCINAKPLKGNDVAPDLEEGKEYEIVRVIACSCGSAHIDVGLKSRHNYISCHTCKAELPNGDVTHWCHPSRFA